MLTKDDFVLMTWDEYQACIDRLTRQLTAYLESTRTKIDCIVPVLRGGGVPAISLAYRLGVVDLQPIQLKHDYRHHTIRILHNAFDRQEESDRSPTILLVDGYHATGRTTYLVYDLIRQKFPRSRILYATLGRDVGYREDEREFAFACHAFVSNECDRIPKEQSRREGMLTKYTLFPWEVLEDEIQNMNDELRYEKEENEE